MSEGMIGKTFGAYTVTGFLGRGGMATVYKGYHAALDRNVAIKVMAADMLEDENFLKRFGNEARLLAKLQHPHILPIYDFGEADGVPYIVMPLMNDSLKDRLKPGQPMTLDEALPIISAIGQALDFAHTQSVLHRDVKPNNVLFDQHDNPFLADFGIARAMQASRGLTGTGILGTLEYMSPEQARGDALDGRSDVYSFGIMAHQMLTGHLAFSSTTPAGMLFKHISEPPRPPREFNPALPATVDQILLKVLAKDPKDRYQTAQEFTKALRDAHAGVVAHTPTAQVVAALTREMDTTPEPVYAPPAAQRLPTATPTPTVPPPAISKPASSNANMIWLIGCGVIALLGCLGLGGTALLAPAMLGLGDPTATPRPTQRPASPTPTPRRPTATPRPTFTPRATESSTNNSSGLSSTAGVFDVFTDNANGWSIERQDSDAAVETFTIANGVLRWEIEAKRDLVSFNSPDGDANFFEDGEVMADFEMTRGPDDAAYALLFRYVDADNYYIFNVSPGTQSYSLFVRVNDVWETLVDYTDASAINRSGINRLRARVEDTTIILEINDQVVETLNDNTIIEAGYAGIAVTLYNAGDQATFEVSRYEAFALAPVLLFDNFENANNPNDWATDALDDEYGVVEPSIENGVYVLDVEAKQGFIYYSSPDMEDVDENTVTVSARRVSGAENVDYGVIFQRSDDGYYYFGVADVGQYTLLRYAGEWATLIDWTNSDAIRSGEFNKLSIRRVDDTLVLHINGEWVNTFEDSDSPIRQGVGGVGFQLYDAGETAEFEFDNFEVRAP